MATQEDRSLSSGMSLPMWMKTKNDKFSNFDQTAFSPTDLDDSFMLYYRKNGANRGISEPPQAIVVSNDHIIKQDNSKTLTAPISQGHKQDFSKHTLYCQKYLTTSRDSTTAQQVKLTPSATKTKSSGVDDGFKGEAAKCGTSVIRVANQMVAGKMVCGFYAKNEQQTTDDGPPKGFNPLARRDSKSLPASPLTSPHSSPKSSRRSVNKYFTAPFVDTENNHGSWILSNLLSKRQKTLSQSVGYIAEGDEGATISKANSSVSIDDVTDASKKKTNLFVAKPSELREMNFWSPTSM